MSSENPSSGGLPVKNEAIAAAAVGSCHRFENVEFDELKGELRVAGQAVAMEPRPLRVLSELLLRVNEVVTKEELFEAVWEGRPTVDHVLANAISKLRGAMGEAGGGRIVTVPRVGYRLNGPVQRVDTLAQRATYSEGQAVPGREGYVLVRVLGEASRSEVWLARHHKLGHQQVFKFASDGPGLQALKREYTLYRVLKHELGARNDFAVVLDTNFVHAPYFLECEYGGQSLLEWAESGGALARLTLPERLALFLKIAHAVAAAHSVGVLHKDLKPANVLVSPVALGPAGPAAEAAAVAAAVQIKLTDFGSGRVLSPEVLQRLKFTALGMTQGAHQDTDSGSFMYIAPELTAGAASTVKCDVFSLGVMLYQLLVADLGRPMASGWQREVGDELLVQDILAATEGAPTQRLASVAELAQRVATLPQRWQARQAQEEAQRQREVERAQDERRRTRQPWLVLAVALAGVGLAVSLWFAAQARSGLQLALQQTQRTQAFENFLTQDVLAADAVFHRENVRPQGISSSLSQAVARLDNRFPDDPLTQLDLRLRVAKVLSMLGANSESGKQAELAYTLAQQFPDRRAERMQAALVLASSNRAMNDDVAAEALVAEAMELGGRDLLDADQPAAIPVVQAQAAHHLGMGRYTESERLARRLVALVDRHTPQDVAGRLDARALLLDVAAETADLAKAQVVAQQMHAEVEALGGSTRAMLAAVERRMAQVQAGQGNVSGAVSMMKDAIQRATLAGPGMELQLAWHWSALGNLQGYLGEFQNALHSLSNATALFQRTLGDDHQFYRVSAVGVGRMQVRLGEFLAAAESLQQHRAWFSRVMDGRPYKPLLGDLAISLAGVRKPEAALAVLDEMAAASEKRQTGQGRVKPTAEEPENLIARGWAWAQMGKTDAGLALMRQGLDQAAQKHGPNGLDVLEAAWAAEAGKKAAARARP